MSDNDEAVRATNDDAASCKRWAVQLGYWKDPYLQYFIRTSEKRAPEINRGYYARVHGIRYFLDEFLRLNDGNCQIVNLGSGFDTLYWRLKDEGVVMKCYVEMDFPAVTSRKCSHIKKTKALLQGVASEDGEVKFSVSDLHGSSYHVVGTDLRLLQDVQQKLHESEVDFNLPTVFIAECVLVYMDPDHCSRLLHWIADNFPTAFFINYEQVNMRDRFGEVMIDNLRKRGCSLAGVEACRDLESQKDRFRQSGWENANAWDMSTVYGLLPQADVQRIEKIEFLDEKELIDQLFQHYCICVAYKDKLTLGLEQLLLM